jgi:Leucine-rich repeat (LRR) protein
LELSSLNLADNQISCLENIANLPKLHTLQLAKNKLKHIENLTELKSSPIA